MTKRAEQTLTPNERQVLALLGRCERGTTQLRFSGSIGQTLSRASDLSPHDCDDAVYNLLNLRYLSLEPSGQGFRPVLTNQGRETQGLEPIVVSKPAKAPKSPVVKAVDRGSWEATKLRILVFLDGCGEPVQTRRITVGADIPSKNSTTAITELETQGLVARHSLEHTKVVRYETSITAAGRSHLRDHPEEVAVALAFAFTAPTPPDRVRQTPRAPTVITAGAPTLLTRLEKSPFKPSDEFFAALAKLIKVDRSTAIAVFDYLMARGEIERITERGQMVGIRKATISEMPRSMFTAQQPKARNSLYSSEEIVERLRGFLVRRHGKFQTDSRKLWTEVGAAIKIRRDLVLQVADELIKERRLRVRIIANRQAGDEQRVVLEFGSAATTEWQQLPVASPTDPSTAPDGRGRPQDYVLEPLLPITLPAPGTPGNIAILQVLSQLPEGRIYSNPGRAVTQLQRYVGLSNGVIHYHVGRLHAAGLIEVQRNLQGTTLVAITAAGRTHLAAREPTAGPVAAKPPPAAANAEKPPESAQPITGEISRDPARGRGTNLDSVAPRSPSDTDLLRVLIYLFVQPGDRAEIAKIEADLGIDIGLTLRVLSGAKAYQHTPFSRANLDRVGTSLVLTRAGSKLLMSEKYVAETALTGRRFEIAGFAK